MLLIAGLSKFKEFIKALTHFPSSAESGSLMQPLKRLIKDVANIDPNRSLCENTAAATLNSSNRMTLARSHRSRH